MNLFQDVVRVHESILCFRGCHTNPDWLHQEKEWAKRSTIVVCANQKCQRAGVFHLLDFLFYEFAVSTSILSNMLFIPSHTGVFDPGEVIKIYGQPGPVNRLAG